MNICEVCHREILVTCFLGTGVCCENCRKIRDEKREKVGSAAEKRGELD